MNHGQHAPPHRESECKKAVLDLGVIWVVKRDGRRISKHARRLAEADAVFREVRASLLVVPVEVHVKLWHGLTDRRPTPKLSGRTIAEEPLFDGPLERQVGRLLAKTHVSFLPVPLRVLPHRGSLVRKQRIRFQSASIPARESLSTHR